MEYKYTGKKSDLYYFSLSDGYRGHTLDKDGNKVDLPIISVNIKTGEIIHHECDESGTVIVNEAGTGINQITVMLELPITFVGHNGVY